MAISSYNVRHEYIGTGAISSYTFDFKITALAHLTVIKTNASFVEVFRVDGTDVTDITSVTYDATDGGGTVQLAAVVESGYHLYLLLANDQPLQESEFKNKASFTLARFEAALDVQSGAIQRLAYLVKRCLKIPEKVLNSVAFDGELPELTAAYSLAVNASGNRFELGPSLTSIDGAVASAAAAAASASASSTSATASAASATAAAASAASAAALGTVETHSVVTAVGAYAPSVSTSRFILFDATSGNQSLTLPAITASNDGLRFYVTKSDASANTVTITGTVAGEVNPVITTRYNTWCVVASNGLWYWRN